VAAMTKAGSGTHLGVIAISAPGQTKWSTPAAT